MFRCVASNIRLVPAYKRQPTPLLVRSRLTSPSTLLWRRSFTSAQACREKVKQETVTKPANKGDVKKLFRLAKPELKSLTGTNENMSYICIKTDCVYMYILAATGLLVISSGITMVKHTHTHTHTYRVKTAYCICIN
jgi:hypothetical protein